MLVALPGAGAIALATATALKSRELDTIELDNPTLSRELQTIRLQAQKLTETAQLLRAEATRRLTDTLHIDLLGTVQYVCDRHPRNACSNRPACPTYARQRRLAIDR